MDAKVREGKKGFDELSPNGLIDNVIPGSEPGSRTKES